MAPRVLCLTSWDDDDFKYIAPNGLIPEIDSGQKSQQGASIKQPLANWCKDSKYFLTAEKF